MTSGAQNPRIKEIVNNYLERKDEQEDEEKKADCIDYFGFYHSPQGRSETQIKQETISRENDIHRFHKWTKMVGKDGKSKHEDNWNKYYHGGKSTEKLKRRIYKGIPNLARTIVWPLLLGVSEIKMSRDRNTFDNLFKIALVKSEFLEQIDLDINRTYRNTSFFVSRFGARQRSLFKVLAAYSVYNPDIGYCQGLSDIAGTLLMYIHDDEDAFWAFCQLLNGPRHSMHGMFTSGFPGLIRLFKHHEKVTSRLLPSLHNHLEKENVITTTYALKWFMQCFISRMPISLTFRLWDIYLLEGEKLLIGQAYNILKMHKKTLMGMDACRIMTFLQDDLAKDFLFSDEDVIDSLKECLEVLHKNRLDVLSPLTDDMKPKQELGLILNECKSDVWTSKDQDQVHHTLNHTSSKTYQNSDGTGTGQRNTKVHSKSAYNTLDNERVSSNRPIDSRHSERKGKFVENNKSSEANKTTENQNKPKVVTNFSGTTATTHIIKHDDPTAKETDKSLSVIITNGVTNPTFSAGPISPPISDACSSSMNHDSTQHTPQPPKDTPPVHNTRQINSISGVPRQLDYSSNSLKRNSNLSSESNYSQLITSTEKRGQTGTNSSSSLPRRDLNAEHQARTYVIASVLYDSVERRVNQSFGPPIASPNLDVAQGSPNKIMQASPDHKSENRKPGEQNNTSGVWIQREFDTSPVLVPSDNIQISPAPPSTNNSGGRIPLVYDISQIPSMMNSPPNGRDGNKSLSQRESPHTPVSRTLHKPTPEQKKKMMTQSNRLSYQASSPYSPSASNITPMRAAEIKSLTNLEDYPIEKKAFEKRTFIIDAEQIDHLIEKASSLKRHSPNA